MTRAHSNPLELIWKRLLFYAERYLSISAVFYRLVYGTFAGPPCFRLLFGEFAKQVYFTSLRGIHIVIFAALLFGLHMILYAAEQLNKISSGEFLGWLLVTVVVRQIGPVLAALFVLVHSGGPIIMEIGTMSVNREIEALQDMGIDPYRYLGVPRLWGVTLGLVLLYIVIVHVAVIGGFYFSQIYSDISLENFWQSFLGALQLSDIIIGVVQAAIFGMIIATVSIYAGFKARGDMGDVAKKMSQGALWSLVFCAFMEVFITTAYYLSPLGTPKSPLGSLPAIISSHLC
jgi:phospholipid/cholesterol/gamma-HCH transport system permease protein